MKAEDLYQILLLTIEFGASSDVNQGHTTSIQNKSGKHIYLIK